MKEEVISLYSRVIYSGASGIYEGVSLGDYGYIIEYYDGENYEVEFYGAGGVTKAQVVINKRFLVVAGEKTENSSY